MNHGQGLNVMASSTTSAMARMASAPTTSESTVSDFSSNWDKFYNSGLPPLYTFAAYRNYYHEISFHKNKYGLPAPTNFEILQQERFGPYYNGVWGNVDQSPYWFGK